MRPVFVVYTSTLYCESIPKPELGTVMSYYVIIPYSYMMRMLYEKEVFLLLVVFGVGTQQMATKMKI